jgi:hypothetical protein
MGTRKRRTRLKIITESDKTKVGRYLLDIIADTILHLELMNYDLQNNLGVELLDKQIVDAPVDGMIGLTLRDRYGQLCDTIINRSLDIASILGFNNDDFRMGIDERVGNTKIYDGEYTQYYCLGPGDFSMERMEFSKGDKRWWAPSRRS